MRVCSDLLFADSCAAAATAERSLTVYKLSVLGAAACMRGACTYTIRTRIVTEYGTRMCHVTAVQVPRTLQAVVLSFAALAILATGRRARWSGEEGSLECMVSTVAGSRGRAGPSALRTLISRYAWLLWGLHHYSRVARCKIFSSSVWDTCTYLCGIRASVGSNSAKLFLFISSEPFVNIRDFEC